VTGKPAHWSRQAAVRRTLARRSVVFTVLAATACGADASRPNAPPTAAGGATDEGAPSEPTGPASTQPDVCGASVQAIDAQALAFGLQQLTIGCVDRSSAQDCYRLAFLKQQQRSPSDADHFYSRACDLGRLEACEDLGLLVERGLCGHGMSRARAQALYEKACHGGLDAACAHVATCMASGCIDPPAPVAAFNFLKQRCDDTQALATSCLFLGHFLEEGIGTTKDAREARAAYARACRGGATEGCVKTDELPAQP
jgi:uncharacterized protein